MRLHGCIFAMTHCHDRLIGIDYQIGKNGKVAQLMQENHLGENCLSVSTLNSDLIVERVNAVLENKTTGININITDT